MSSISRVWYLLKKWNSWTSNLLPIRNGETGFEYNSDASFEMQLCKILLNPFCFWIHFCCWLWDWLGNFLCVYLFIGNPRDWKKNKQNNNLLIIKNFSKSQTHRKQQLQKHWTLLLFFNNNIYSASVCFQIHLGRKL